MANIYSAVFSLGEQTTEGVNEVKSGNDLNVRNVIFVVFIHSTKTMSLTTRYT